MKFFGDFMDRNYVVINFISKFFFKKRTREVNLADIIKIVTMIIKATLKDSQKLKRVRQLCIKMQSISVFIDVTKIANFR